MLFIVNRLQLYDWQRLAGDCRALSNALQMVSSRNFRQKPFQQHTLKPMHLRRGTARLILFIKGNRQPNGREDARLKDDLFGSV